MKHAFIKTMMSVAAFTFLFAGFSSEAKAGEITSVNAGVEGEILTVSGQAAEDVLSVAIFVYSADGKTLLQMESVAVDEKHAYSDTFEVKGSEYTVKVADYNGGSFKTVKAEKEDGTSLLKKFNRGSLNIDETAGFLKGVIAKMTVSELQDRCNYEIKVIKAKDSTQASADDKLCTGDAVKFLDAAGEEMDSYQICVSGDVNGDGVVNVEDMERIQKSVLKLELIQGVYEQAGLLTTGAVKLSVTDMEIIQKDILGIRKISE